MRLNNIDKNGMSNKLTFIICIFVTNLITKWVKLQQSINQN